MYISDRRAVYHGGGRRTVDQSGARNFADFEYPVCFESDHGIDGRHDDDYCQYIDRIAADCIAAQTVQVDPIVTDPCLHRIRAYDGRGDGIARMGRCTYVLAAMARMHCRNHFCGIRRKF